MCVSARNSGDLSECVWERKRKKEREKYRQETYGTAAAIIGRIRSRYRCREIAGNRAGTTCAKYEYLHRRKFIFIGIATCVIIV